MKYFVMISLIVLSVLLSAAPVDRDTAALAARNWAQVWAPAGFDARAIEQTIPLGDRNEPALYLFQYNDGFVVTSADDAVKPVLAYGFDTVVGSIEDNPAFRDYLLTLQQEIIEIRQSGLDNSFTAIQWRDVLSNNIERNGTRSVAPLISTKWNQGWPYNMYCPVDAAGPGGHVYAGCVATAMGQVLKYWNWPITGTGTHSYYAQGYGNQSVNFGNTTYQWAQMPNSVHTPNDAVATLLYHLGVSVNMMYAPDGSGAYSAAVPSALIDHFRYATNAQQKMKSNFSSSVWEQMLRDELDSARPLYYSGSGSGGGHAFNCDGYQGTNYFHFNWGWSGSYDGYYYVSNLNPGSTFNNYQGAVFNIMPINYNIGAVQMSMAGTNCSVGETATLEVITYPILPDWNVTSLNFVVEYDHEFVNYVGYETTGTMLEGDAVSVMQMQPGSMAFSVNCSSALSGAGTLFKVKFQPTIPGDFVFNLGSFSLNSTPVTLLSSVTINVMAEVSELQNSVIDLMNAMHIPYDAIATVPLTTTFLLPTWNVTTASFSVSYPDAQVSWEGYDSAGTLAENAQIAVTETVPGQLDFSLNFNGMLVGNGELLKLRFRAIGNVGHVSLATLTISDFYYNQTLVLNMQPGYIVLLPVTANEDEVTVVQNSFTAGPNPFNATTRLNLTLSKSAQPAEIKVYNLKGQLVKTIFSGEVKSNRMMIDWNGRDDQNKEIPAGIYLLKVRSGEIDKTVKLLKQK